MRHSGITIAAFAFLIASCSGSSRLDSTDSGRTRAFVAGIPNFDMEALVRSVDGVASLETHISIPRSSLVFVQSSTGFEAEYDLLINVIDRQSEAAVFDTSRTETLRVEAYDSTLLPMPDLRKLSLDVPPGSYIVEATVTDLETDESAERRQAVVVPGRGETNPHMGRIHLEARREGRSFEPQISLHLPAWMDSLRASVELLNLDATDEVTLTMELVKFESDTSIASPPYWLVPTRASLASRGIFYDEADTIQVSRREISAPDEDVTVVFSLPRLAPGMYRIRIVGLSPDRESPIGEQDRMLSVKNATYPQIASLNDLIEALAYIASDDEVGYIRSAESSVEAKRRFDAFWGARASNRNVAANLIKLYYGRVEEANLYFTGYKEGWKTDRGMVYIVMGPPIYIDNRVESETWYYSYGDRDPANIYLFERVQTFGDFGFDNYILQRHPYYQHEWTRAIDLWRRAAVL